MLCPNCGKNNKNGEAFCQNCGAALARVQAQKNVQKAVDAYGKAPKSTDQSNVVSVVIIVFLCLLLVGVLVLLAPALKNLLSADPDNSNESGEKEPSSQVAAPEVDAFTQNPYYDCFKAHDEYVLPDSSNAFLTRDDLKSLSSEELTVAQQEILARHGKRFNDSNLQAYFEQRGWYAPSASVSKLNTYETANQILLEVYIAQLTGTYSQPGNPYLNQFSGTDSFALRNSQSRYLDASELKSMNEKQLEIARNEIHARHGYVFTDENLQTYFCTKSWYTPKSSTIADNLFSEYESNNIKLIQLYERKLKGVNFSADNPYAEFYQYGSNYIISGSDTDPVSTYDLTGFSAEKCALARNEIFARHGYAFTDEELLEYFLQQDWYWPAGKIGDSSEISLTDIERKNVDALQDFEEVIKSLPENLSGLDHTPSVAVSGSMFSVKIPTYWKDYSIHESSNNHLQFSDKISNSLGYGGHLVTFATYSSSAKGEYEVIPNHTVLGVLTDSAGNQWDLIAYYPSDVQYDSLSQQIYHTMKQDVHSICATVTPAAGYTYTPF